MYSPLNNTDTNDTDSNYADIETYYLLTESGKKATVQFVSEVEMEFTMTDSGISCLLTFVETGDEEQTYVVEPGCELQWGDNLSLYGSNGIYGPAGELFL